MAKKIKAPPVVSEVLRAAIENSGQTVYAISKASGVGQQVIGRFVKRERNLNSESIDKLCVALGLRLEKGEGDVTESR